MSLTEEITKNAILGTNKYFISDFEYLATFTQKVEQHFLDKEDQLLKTAAVAFAYEEVGNEGVAIENTLEVCPEDRLVRANQLLQQLIANALATKDDILLKYFVFFFHKSNLLVEAQLVPAMLNKALANRAYAAKCVQVCGTTGEWLCKVNPQWQVLASHAQTDDVWETGQLAARKDYFAEMRKNDASQALTMLTKVIAQENAQVRYELIELLAINLSIEDEDFLKKCLSDTSAKVKKIAYELLKKMNGSELNQQFLAFVSEAISVEQETTALVFKKQVIKWKEQTVPPEIIFKAGVEKVSSQKGIDDFSYWVAQALAYTDPEKLAQKYNISEAELLKLLLKHEKKNLLLPYLIRSAVYFSNEIWATSLLEANEIDIDLLGILPLQQQKLFYNKLITQSFHQFYNHVCTEDYAEFDADVSKNILQQLFNSTSHVYMTNQQYRTLALYLKAETRTEIERYLAKEDMNAHNKNQCAEMLRILEIKNNLTNQQ